MMKLNLNFLIRKIFKWSLIGLSTIFCQKQLVLSGKTH